MRVTIVAAKIEVAPRHIYAHVSGVATPLPWPPQQEQNRHPPIFGRWQGHARGIRKWPINHHKREKSFSPTRTLHSFQRTEAGFGGLARADLRSSEQGGPYTRQVAQVASATKRRYSRVALRFERLSQALANLVSIALYTGTSATERVSFRQINNKTGNRLRQQLVDEVTRELVESKTRGAATNTPRTPTSRWMTTSSTPSRSRASTPSKSTRSSRASRSTSGISTAPTTSRRMAKSGRTHLR